jgi:hypothetical protein
MIAASVAIVMASKVRTGPDIHDLPGSGKDGGAGAAANDQRGCVPQQRSEDKRQQMLAGAAFMLQRSAVGSVAPPGNLQFSLMARWAGSG